MGWRAIRSPLLRGILAASVPGMGIALPAPAVAAFSPPARLSIVTDDNDPPFLFRDAEGRLQGILKDKWELWSRKTGIPVTVDGTAWADAQARIGTGAAKEGSACAAWLGSPLRASVDRSYFYYLLAAVAAGLAAGAILLIAWNRSLQQRVSARTAELAGQNQVLELIAQGTPLQETLDTLLKIVEIHSRGMLSSILLLDEDGLRLRHASAPSLPEGFRRAIDGQPIGERAGSCGTAAFFRSAVVVEDVLADPRWSDYRELAIAHGLRACWSTPIFGAQQRLLGTFALYFREPRLPTRYHQRLIGAATHLAAIAIDKKREEDALRESAARLQRLSRHLVDTQETERRAISRELHDRIGQNLSALNLSLGLMRRQLPEDFLQKMRGRFDDAQGLLESTVQQVRNVMADLRPAVLDDYGLAAALDAFAKPFGERLGIPIAVLGELQPRPSIAVETALFRIAQEALNNVGKHARARNVVVKLETRPAGLRLTVDDDGAGFEPACARAGVPTYGVITMRERAEAVGADLRIQSAPGRGTRVVVEVASARA